VKKQAKSNRL